MAVNICLSAGVGATKFGEAVKRICKLRKESLTFRYNELEELKDAKMYTYYVACVTGIFVNK